MPKESTRQRGSKEQAVPGRSFHQQRLLQEPWKGTFCQQTQTACRAGAIAQEGLSKTVSQTKAFCLSLHTKPQLSLMDSSEEAPCEVLSHERHSSTKVGMASCATGICSGQRPETGISYSSHQISEHNVDLVSLVPSFFTRHKYQLQRTDFSFLTSHRSPPSWYIPLCKHGGIVAYCCTEGPALTWSGGATCLGALWGGRQDAHATTSSMSRDITYQ